MPGLLDAISFLTTLPVPGGGRRTFRLQQATAWFPLVGALVGMLAGFAAWLPVGGDLGALLIVLLWLALTGGLHLDGLADCADAALASVDAERRQEILHDVHAGTWAVVAIVSALLSRWVALRLLVVNPALCLAGTTAAAALARGWSVVALHLHAPQANSRLASAARPTRAALAIAVVLLVAVQVLLLSSVSSAAVAMLLQTTGATLLCAAIVSYFLSRRLGGFGGDAAGATIEVTEVAFLLFLTAHLD